MAGAPKLRSSIELSVSIRAGRLSHALNGTSSFPEDSSFDKSSRSHQVLKHSGRLHEGAQLNYTPARRPPVGRTRMDKAQVPKETCAGFMKSAVIGND